MTTNNEGNKKLTWRDIVNDRIPGWSTMSEINRRRTMSKATMAGYNVDLHTGLVTIKNDL